jgi:hypothetical protein
MDGGQHCLLLTVMFRRNSSHFIQVFILWHLPPTFALRCHVGRQLHQLYSQAPCYQDWTFSGWVCDHSCPLRFCWPYPCNTNTSDSQFYPCKYSVGLIQAWYKLRPGGKRLLLIRHDFICCINQILALKGWGAILGHLFHIGGTLFYLMAGLHPLWSKLSDGGNLMPSCVIGDMWIELQNFIYQNWKVSVGFPFCI